MKRLNYLFCVIFFFTSIVYSCKDTNDPLDLSEALLEEYPDSALIILDSIFISDLPKGRRLHRYNLLRIQAKDKSYQDISQDSSIFETADYYIKKNDYLKAAQSKYYCGRLLYESEFYKEAIQAYLEASKYAESLPSDYNLKGTIQTNIGYLLFRESAYNDALIHFKQASEFFRQDDNITNEITIKIEIGNCYTMLAKNDSAYVYYNEGLQLADATKLADVKLLALQNLALIYQVQGQTNTAIELYNKALSLSTDSLDIAKLYLSLTRMYSQSAKKDSAIYFLNKATQINEIVKEPYFETSLYSISSEINEQQGNYKNALADYKKYSFGFESLSLEKERKALLDIQKKYQFERMKNYSNKLYIRNIQFAFLSIILALALIISVLIFYFHYKKKKILLENANNKILQLDDLATSYNAQRNSFRDTLLHHFDILKKMAMLRMQLKKNDFNDGEKILKKINDIVYKQQELDWDMLYATMNKLHYGFLEKLREIAPDLDESEFRICCLIYSDFSNQEIGIIMKLSNNTITHKRSSIRRKMKLEDYGNIQEYLKYLSEKH